MNNKVNLIDIVLFRLYYISMVVEDSTRVKDYLTKTKLQTLDYVINPYVGCPNKCLYCYAAYMSSFSKHAEEWGEFIDVKRTSKKINLYKIKNKKVMISTVTDPYNSYEEKSFHLDAAVFGLNYQDRPVENSSENLIRHVTVVSNRPDEMEYRILLNPEDSAPCLIQDFSKNREFELSPEEHGECTLSTRLVCDPENTLQTIIIAY